METLLMRAELNILIFLLDPFGHPVLRHEIAQRYKTIQENDVMVTAGAQEALFVALKAMSDSVNE